MFSRISSIACHGGKSCLCPAAMAHLVASCRLNGLHLPKAISQERDASGGGETHRKAGRAKVDLTRKEIGRVIEL